MPHASGLLVGGRPALQAGAASQSTSSGPVSGAALELALALAARLGWPHRQLWGAWTASRLPF